MKTNSFLAFVIKLSLVLNGVFTRGTPKHIAYRNIRDLNCRLKLNTQENTRHFGYEIPRNSSYEASCKINDLNTKIGSYYLVRIEINAGNKRVFHRREKFWVRKSWYTDYLTKMDETFRFVYEGINKVKCDIEKYAKNDTLLEVCRSNIEKYVKRNLKPAYKKVTSSKRKTYYPRYKPRWTEKPKFISTTNSNKKSKFTTILKITRSKNTPISTKDTPKLQFSKTENSFSINQMLISPILYILLFFFIYCFSIGTIVTAYKIRPRFKK